MRPAFLALGLTLLAAGSAVAAAPSALPTYTQAYEPQGVDERGMWQEADDYERYLRHSSLVIRDEELNAFVRGVLCRTVGDDRCGSVRIYVLRIPEFNAAMYPNGMMTVQSGLLLRARSEAELGAVLGHEFGHFELRHGLEGFKRQRASNDALAWLRLAAATGSENGATQEAIVGAFYSFNREQEAQADLLGQKYLAKSSYPSNVAATNWERLMAEQDATAAGRHQKKVKHSSVAGFLATHPPPLKRAAYLRAEAKKVGDDNDDPRAASYRAAIDKWLPAFLDDQIKLNDFGGSEYLLNGLAQGGWTHELLFARARLHLLRGAPRDLVAAAQFFQEAIDKGSQRPEAYRDLGFALIKTQRSAEGKASLRRYLELSPEAPDAKIIRTLVGT